MKKIASSLILFLSFTSVRSQITWNIFGGPQATYAKYTVPLPNKTYEKQDASFKYGFQLGVGMKVPFDVKLFFSPAVFYSMKGVKINEFKHSPVFPASEAHDQNLTMHTFEIAPMLQYDFSESPDHFFIKAGPSVDLQLFGHEEYNMQNGEHRSGDIKFGTLLYSHFGANLIGQIGYETEGGLIIFAHYSYGASSIVNLDSGPRIHHRAMGISFGYTIGKKK